MTTLQKRWRNRLERTPEARALAFVDRRGRFEWRSFAELYSSAARRGAALAELGLRPGEACVVMGHSDERTATALLGAFLAGGLPVLVAPPVVRGLHSNQAEVLRHVVRKTRARLVVVDEERPGIEAGGAGARLITAAALAGGEAAALPAAAPRPTDVAAYQLTSGTTGFPRVCVWQQRRVLAALDGMAAAMGLGEDDICVNWTPLYHDMGLVNNLLLCLTAGVPLAFLHTLDFIRDPALWLRALADTGATVTWSPNFGFALAARRVRDEALGERRLDGVRAFWNAAERVHAETLDAFHRRFAAHGVRRSALKTNFGCAENVGGATFTAPGEEAPVEHVDVRRLLRDRVAVPVAAPRRGRSATTVVGVGRPYPGLRISIRSRTGRELSEGHVGEIALDTPSRLVGYLGDARASRRALADGRVRTGDLGYLRGGELFWVGRLRERINLRGKKLDPSDFERLLLAIPGLRQGCFAAFGVDDPELGSQRLVLVSEVRGESGRSLDELAEDIREGVAESLGVAVDEVLLLPPGTMTKTTSGKRRHRFYRRLYLEGELHELAARRA